MDVATRMSSPAASISKSSLAVSNGMARDCPCMMNLPMPLASVLTAAAEEALQTGNHEAGAFLEAAACERRRLACRAHERGTLHSPVRPGSNVPR